MTGTLRSLLEDIEALPPGPQIAALFDLDRTLIKGFSVQDVFLERILTRDMKAREVGRTLRNLVRYKSGRISFAEFVANTVRELAGKTHAESMEFSDALFARRVARRIYPESRRLVEAHRARGHTLVVVSSATFYQVEPVARDLGIDHMLYTQLEVTDEGVCTGDVLGLPCYGPAKLAAAHALGEELNFAIDEAFFYSDGFEDVPLLEAVAYPRVLNPDAKLARYARRMGWPITRFNSRKHTHAGEMLYTPDSCASLPTAGGLALVDFMLGQGSQQMRDVVGATWGEWVTAALELPINVVGGENLWSHGSVVYAFNHQSRLDALIMARLLRQNFTGIVEDNEAQSQSDLSQKDQAPKVIFINRSGRIKATRAMSSVVGALRSGVSVVMAPEGKHSPTRSLLPFRKDAFLLAMRACVPVVPVVLRNTADFVPEGAGFAYQGAVEVEVLEPVDTSVWRRGRLAAHVADVRGKFLEVLGQT